MRSEPAIAPPTCEFDKRVLEEIEKRQRRQEPVSTLVFGIGAEAQGLRMAVAGASVLVVADDCALAEQNGLRCVDTATFWADDSDQGLPGEPYDLILSQRALNTLRYEDARRAVRRLLLKLRLGGRLYLTLHGIHSELGDHYPDGNKLVERRFAPLPPDIAQRHGIGGPICLYSERNLFSLLFEAGGAVLHTSTSTLGVVRAIAARV